MAKTLTHLGKRGEARMVDVSDKAATERVAIAEGRVVMSAKTLDLVLKGNAKKGDVLGAARIAGIMAAKRTHELIPLCHPLALSQGRGRHRAGPQAARPRGTRDRQGHGPDRRRDGGADRGLGRLPDHLRHGEGGRARHAHRGHPPDREARRQVRPLSARRSDCDGADVGRRGAARGCSTAPSRCPPKHVAARRARTAACSPTISPRGARSRRPTSRRWTATRCAPPMSRQRRRR